MKLIELTRVIALRCVTLKNRTHVCWIPAKIKKASQALVFKMNKYINKFTVIHDLMQCNHTSTKQILGMLRRNLWILKHTLLFTISTLEDYFTLIGSVWTQESFLMFQHFNILSFLREYFFDKSAHLGWEKQHLGRVWREIRKRRLDEQLSLEDDIFYYFWPRGIYLQHTGGAGTGGDPPTSSPNEQLATI